ncbi:MAG: hypothetical protein IMW97_02345 [Firmicutes bacterium]|nr:hypothetical protein [Candidatus Fermentithermobacillaceae bacterium]
MNGDAGDDRDEGDDNNGNDEGGEGDGGDDNNKGMWVRVRVLAESGENQTNNASLLPI